MGKEEEKEGNINWFPFACALTRDQTCNPGMCPDRELNQWSYAMWNDTQPTKTHQSGLNLFYFLWFPLVVRTLHVGVPWAMLQAFPNPNLDYQNLPVLGSPPPEHLHVKETKWINDFIIRCKWFIFLRHHFLDAYGLFNSMITYWSPTMCKHYIIDNRDLDK